MIVRMRNFRFERGPTRAALHRPTTLSLTGRGDGSSIAVWWGYKEEEVMEFRRPTILV